MYDDYSIDELVERSQETIGEESNRIKRELARRFRDGVGVEADSVEASYWESQIEQSTSEAEKPASPETLQSVGTVTPETAYTEADCKAMDERTLYQAFRTGAPWAVYYFSLHMKDQGEHSHALSELEELAKTLEHKMDGGDTSEETRRILALTKLQMGRLYCHDLTRAQRCFEEAALELGCREAVPDLINCYCRDLPAWTKGKCWICCDNWRTERLRSVCLRQILTIIWGVGPLPACVLQSAGPGRSAVEVPCGDHKSSAGIG